MVLVILALAVVVTVAVFAALRQAVQLNRGLSLELVLLGWQSLYWFGALCLLLSETSAETRQFVLIASIAQLSLTVGVLIAQRPRPHASSSLPYAADQPLRYGWALAVIAASVCVIFSITIVRNEDLGSILASVLTGDESFLNYRLVMSTGGAVYLAPGYVKQFRDILLLGSLLFLSSNSPRVPVASLASLLSVGFVAAVLSGERAVLMVFFFALGAMVILRPHRSAQSRRFIGLSAAAVIVAAFVAATYLLGRTTVDATFVEIIGESISGLIDRVVLTVPRENAEGYGFWSAIAPTWGASWFEDLLGILPGVQSSLGNEIHAFLGGSPLGNSALGLSSDLYLNWGLIGVALLPAAMAVALARFDEFLLDGASGLLRAVRIVILPLTFAWYSPFLFLLNGGAVLVMFGVWKRLRQPHASAAH